MKRIVLAFIILTSLSLAQRERHFTNLQQITFGGSNAEAYFSGDGTHLIFQATGGDLKCDQIYTMKIDGSDKILVSNGEGRTTCAYFFPDGKKIVYASTFDNDDDCPPEPDRSKGYVWGVFNAYDIYIANADGSRAKVLTASDGYDAEATISPDGKEIVFTSTRDGDLDLYIMNADGSSVTKIKEITGESCDEVDWSPDGTMMAYATAVGPLSPTYKAYKINADGTGLVNLGEGYYLVWNADGSKVFMTAPADSYKLTSINPDGTGAAALTLFGYYPQEISPDGTKMLFGGDVPATEIVGGGTGTKSGLFHGNANGSGSYTLIFENVTSPQELYCDLGCSWSQDGTKIVYDKYLSGSGMGIYIANLDGSGATLLSSEAASPDWNK